MGAQEISQMLARRVEAKDAKIHELEAVIREHEAEIERLSLALQRKED